MIALWLSANADGKIAEHWDAMEAEMKKYFAKWSDAQKMEDGSHPSEIGSRIAAETIAAVIQKNQEMR